MFYLSHDCADVAAYHTVGKAVCCDYRLTEADVGKEVFACPPALLFLVDSVEGAERGVEIIMYP